MLHLCDVNKTQNCQPGARSIKSPSTRGKFTSTSSSLPLSWNSPNDGFRARGSNLTTSLNRSAKGLFGAHWAEWPLILQMAQKGCCSVNRMLLEGMFPNYFQLLFAWKMPKFHVIAARVILNHFEWKWAWKCPKFHRWHYQGLEYKNRSPRKTYSLLANRSWN